MAALAAPEKEMSETGERHAVVEPSPPAAMAVPVRRTLPWRRKGKKPNPIPRPRGGDLTAGPVPAHSPGPQLLMQTLAKSFHVAPEDLAKFVPTDADMKIGEAIAAGVTAPSGLVTATGLEKEAVTATLNNPVAMLWISQRLEALFKFRAGLVDAALFMRAMAGDVAAIKLFFERHRLLTDQKTLNVVYSGGVDVRALPTDELQKIVQDRARMLPAEFRVLGQTPAEAANGDATDP